MILIYPGCKLQALTLRKNIQKENLRIKTITLAFKNYNGFNLPHKERKTIAKTK